MLSVKKYKHSRLCSDVKSAEHPGKGQACSVRSPCFPRLLFDAMRIKWLPTCFTPGLYMASEYASVGSETVAPGHTVVSELAEFNDGRRLLRENPVSRVR